MYNYFFCKSALVATALGCSVLNHLCAGQESFEFSVRQSTFQNMAYSAALRQLHAGLSEDKIRALVKQQERKDLITLEDMHNCALGELIVLPNKKSVLALRTVLKLILEGHRYDPFTRVPFTDAFCEALSTIVSINCTSCTVFYDIPLAEGPCYDWLLTRLCGFYIKSYSEDAMCNIILRLQVDERNKLCQVIDHTLFSARRALLGPTHNIHMVISIFSSIIAAAKLGKAQHEDVTMFKRMSKNIQRNRRVSSAMRDVVQQNWIVPLERAQKALQKETLIAYGLEHERCLRNWRHWKKSDT